MGFLGRFGRIRGGIMKHCQHGNGVHIIMGNKSESPQVCCFCGEQRNNVVTFVHHVIPGHGRYMPAYNGPGIPQWDDPWVDEECPERKAA